MAKEYGVMGKGVSHSLSPMLHTFFAERTSGYIYEKRFDVEASEIEALIKDTTYTGFNVTSPHKREVIQYLDEVDPMAAELNSVNTIKRMPDGRLLGYNTDVYGFMMTIGAKRVKGRKVLVLGTGGASSAVIEGLRRMEAREILVVSRHSGEGQITYEEMNNHLDAEIVVNCTPIGMYPNNGVSPLDDYDFKWTDMTNLEVAVDLIYNPHRTKFLMDAEAAGAEIQSGLPMLVFQGLQSAQIWGEIPEDPGNLGDEALEEILFNLLNIVMIGMPGSGKSSIARQLAKRLNRPFVDIDRYIESEYGMSANDIIIQKGEAAFRDIETEAMKVVCRQGGQVISSGGGAIVRPENGPIMRENSIVVYLKRPAALLTTKGRFVSTTVGVEELYRQRKERYEKTADIIIENNYRFGGSKGKNGDRNTYMHDMRRFVERMRRKIFHFLDENYGVIQHSAE